MSHDVLYMRPVACAGLHPDCPHVHQVPPEQLQHEDWRAEAVLHTRLSATSLTSRLQAALTAPQGTSKDGPAPGASHLDALAAELRHLRDVGAGVAVVSEWYMGGG